MPTSDALTGLGLPPQLAEVLGGNPSKVTGVGTAQVGAGKGLTKNLEMSVAAGQTAVILKSVLMEPIYVFNAASTATAALVFPPVGHTMNGSLNASVSVAQNKGAILWQYKPTFWASVLSA